MSVPVSTRRPGVLREVMRDGIRWQAQRSADRGRLVVVAVVPPSTATTIVTALSESELRELLADVPSSNSLGWVYVECGATNEPGRRWCRACSSHGGVAP